MITNIYYANRAGEDILKYVREKDPQTEVERLLQPYELEDPDYIELGQEEAYKVSLASQRLFQAPDLDNLP